jgi:hypothetical protein
MSESYGQVEATGYDEQNGSFAAGPVSTSLTQVRMLALLTTATTHVTCWVLGMTKHHQSLQVSVSSTSQIYSTSLRSASSSDMTSSKVRPYHSQLNLHGEHRSVVNDGSFVDTSGRNEVCQVSIAKRELDHYLCT